MCQPYIESATGLSDTLRGRKTYRFNINVSLCNNNTVLPTFTFMAIKCIDQDKLAGAILSF